MASTTELRKSYLETAKTLSTKPFYAWAGAGDLAVEKLREVPQKVSKLSIARIRAEVSIEKPKQFVSDVPGKISAKVKELPKTPKEVAAKLPSPKELQTRLTEATEDRVKAVDAKFDELADRGESIVKRVRSQKATTDLVNQAKTTVAKAKAVPTTAAAKSTVTAVKSTATAARKTAAKAAPAVKAAAAKVGDEA